MKNFKLVFIFVALLIFTACSKSDTSKNIYDYKTDYVGDNSKVINIIEGVKMPPIIKRGDVKIMSDKEPYGIVIYLENIEDMNPKDLSPDVAVYFSLISNLGYVEYKDNNENTIVKFTRDEVDNFLKEKYFKTSKEIGESEDSFYKYIEESKTELTK